MLSGFLFRGRIQILIPGILEGLCKDDDDDDLSSASRLQARGEGLGGVCAGVLAVL